MSRLLKRQLDLDRIIAEIEGITDATIIECAMAEWEAQDVEIRESKPSPWFDLAVKVCMEQYRVKP